MEKVWKEIENLSHGILFDLLWQYNAYVIEICDREDGSVPVCLPEFYQNEYQDIMEQNKASH